MKKKLLFRLLALALLAATALSLAPSASAAGETGKLTVSYPLEGTVYHLYRVGSLKDGGIVMDDDFSAVDTSDMAAAVGAMAEMIQRTGLRQPLANAAVTDGKATFTDLPMAVYLVTGEPGEENGVNYWPTPFLLSVPQKDEQQRFVWDVEVMGKREMDMTLSVIKRWVGDTAASRPASITVHLVLDGKDYGDPVQLSADNGWTYTWENLPPKNWYIREDVSSRYTAAVARAGNTFILTNTYKRIPQTGQLWWPVTALTAVGLVLLCAGMVRRRKSDKNA